MDTDEVAKMALSYARKLACTDVSIICTNSNESQVRFANNVITLVNNVRNLTVEIYISTGRKRMMGATYNPTADGVEKFVSSLVKSCVALPESRDYAPLPTGPFRYNGHANFDSKVSDMELIGYAKQAIDHGINAGAKRVSGSLNTESIELSMLTSEGATGKDKQSQILLNIRAFSDDNSSGQGLSCASYISSFDSERAGRKAGDDAKRSRNPKMIQDGSYDVIFSSTVVANILPVASNASAFSIESGNSFLADKLGQEVAVANLTIDDYGVYEGGLGGRIFDDEGVATGKNEILVNGKFISMLHNSTTAKKFGKKSTGNAGIIAPRPSTVVFGGGSSSLEEIIRESRSGILITNNWYTRYQNMRSGEYSTVPRDAAFRIENGDIKEPISGLRVSDSIPRQLKNIQSITKEREWVRWWEVRTPTLAPAMKVTGVHITRATGS